MYPQEEPLAENLPFLATELRKRFRRKIRSLTVSYETLNGFAINPMRNWSCTKPVTDSYETVKDPYFPTKPFPKFRSAKNRFSARDSSRGYTGRILTGSVELWILFLGVLPHSVTFSSLQNLFCEFRNKPIF